MKKNWFRLFTALLITLVLATAPVIGHADVGGFSGDYDYGSDWDSDWDSDWGDWDSDW